MFQENLKKAINTLQVTFFLSLLTIMAYGHIRRRRRRRAQKGGIFPLLPLAAAALGPIVGGIASQLGRGRRIRARRTRRYRSRP